MDLPVNEIVCGDNLEVMRGWPDNVIDTVITDPPYGLEFMGKEWDRFGVSETRARRLTQTEKPQDAQKYDYLQGKGRYSEMSVTEKSAMQEFFYQWAKEVLRVAKPGAMMLVFGGTRTSHRLICAIEDAGWQIRDKIFWAFGSGFPKSHNISKAIDKVSPRKGVFDEFAKHYETQRKEKGLTHNQICERGKFYDKYNHGGASSNWASGANVPTHKQWAILKPLLGLSTEFLPLIERIEAEREIVGKDKNWGQKGTVPLTGYKEFDITKSATDLAKLWDGYGTALKPAYEDIVVAMKPLDGTFAHNAEKWGVAGLNIDGGRIGNETVGARPSNKDGITRRNMAFGMKEFEGNPSQGRWPSNLILSHTPDCNDECTPDCPVRLLDEQSGKTGAHGGKGQFKQHSWMKQDIPQAIQASSGGASRFYKNIEISKNCSLCGLPTDERLGIMSEKGDSLCSVKNVAEDTNQTGEGSGSVPVDAPQRIPQKNEGKPAKLNTSVPAVEKNLLNTPETSENTAQQNALNWSIKQFAQNAKSAGSLCDLCAISIAQSIVAIKQGQSLESHLGKVFTNERKRQILNRCLVLFVESQVSTDTIPTMASLNLLFGYVRDAIQSYIQTNATASEAVPTRFKYQSKASRSERNAGLDCDPQITDDGRKKKIDNAYLRGKTLRQNSHPTVKPLKLMEYLCTLTKTPTGGIVLDPFGGSGTTAVACINTGRDYILIEKEKDYVEIAQKRVAWAEKQKQNQMALFER